MTDEEIDELEAGPEIDALVAEKVMGYEVEFVGGKPRYNNPIPAKEFGGIWTTQVPAYSSLISEAWLIVETLKDVNRDVASLDFDLIYNTHEGSGWKDDAELIEKSVQRILPKEERWFAGFGCDEDELLDKPWGGSAHGSTPSLAICRAALKAVNK